MPIKIKKDVKASVVSYRDRTETEDPNELNNYLVFGSYYKYPGVEFLIHEDEIKEFSKKAWDKKVSG